MALRLCIEMTRRTGDADEYAFLSTPGANLECRFDPAAREVQLFGNRAGVLSLANVLLWLHANSWRRELLSLAELPFVRLLGSVSICIRIIDVERPSSDGTIGRMDKGESFEWIMTDDELQRVSLVVHGLASRPHHEYDRLVLTADSECGIHLRMTDAASWL